MAAGICDFCLRSDFVEAPRLVLPVVRLHSVELALTPPPPVISEPPPQLPAREVIPPVVEPAPESSAEPSIFLKQAQVVMVSLAVHLVVFILLALLTCTLQEKNYVTILAAAFAEESPPVEQVVELSRPEEATFTDAGLGEGLTSTVMDGGPAELTVLEIGYQDLEAKSRSQGRDLLSGAGARRWATMRSSSACGRSARNSYSSSIAQTACGMTEKLRKPKRNSSTRFAGSVRTKRSMFCSLISGSKR